jgi:hypothetical protein
MHFWPNHIYGMHSWPNHIYKRYDSKEMKSIIFFELIYLQS